MSYAPPRKNESLRHWSERISTKRKPAIKHKLDEVPLPRRGCYPKELKPCPFCGGHPTVSVEAAPPGIYDFIGVVIRIKCEDYDRCSVRPRLGMQFGKRSSGRNYSLKKLNPHWLRHRFEDKLWRTMCTIWNRRKDVKKSDVVRKRKSR